MTPIELLKELESISKATGESLTHFIPSTRIQSSPISKKGRFALELIPKNTLVGIIGGLLVTTPDNQIAMPISKGLYLNQLFMNQRATANHSCKPNLKLNGFNKLIAKTTIQSNEELTIDYGSLCVGNGSVIIKNCQCGSNPCRKIIKTDDYLLLPKNQLGAYACFWKSKNKHKL